MVDADNYISRYPGSIYHTSFKSYIYKMFSYGCGFVDHFSGFMSIKYQLSVNANETIKDKITFENEAQNQGVEIKGD